MITNMYSVESFPQREGEILPFLVNCGIAVSVYVFI